MLVLVTGGTGFVGSHTAVALKRAGHRVRLLVRDPGKAKRVFASHGLEPDEVVTGDVLDASSVERALEGCDAVVHAAGLVSLESKRAREVAETNLGGARCVIGGAYARGIPRIVYVSSISVILALGGAPATADSGVVSAASAYAQSKADAERFVRGLQDSRGCSGGCS